MLKNSNKVKAVIFDMDGVLFLSSDCHAKAFEETLKSHDITDFLYSDVAGMRTDEAMKKVFAARKKPLSDDILASLVAEKQSRAREALVECGSVAEYSNELLQRLGKKYRLALATSASERTLEIYLDKSQQQSAFEVLLTGVSVAKAKPAPDIYQLAAKKLDLAPDECVIIEDAINGVQAAVAAGIPVIAVVGVSDHAPFLEAGASVVVSGLEDVATLFRSPHENSPPRSG